MEKRQWIVATVWRWVLPTNQHPNTSFLRHTFWLYRKENPKTRVGEPPPEGLPGFNSGVMLLDLSAMRASTLYNQLLKPSNVAKLAEQYRFKGHLGDQDFFTMIGMEHPELFYSLACGWNRQLCTWWRDHGYGDVFQLYYGCDGPVYIYHGNCNSPIPDDWTEKDIYCVAEGNIFPANVGCRTCFPETMAFLTSHGACLSAGQEDMKGCQPHDWFLLLYFMFSLKSKASVFDNSSAEEACFCIDGINSFSA